MPERHPSLSSVDIEKILRRQGFKLSRQKGSHQQFVGFIKGKKHRVTLIAGRRDFPQGTVKSIIHQSGLSEEEFYGKN